MQTEFKRLRGERWAVIKGSIGYAVSSHGRFATRWKTGGRKKAELGKVWKLRTPSSHKQGYKLIAFKVDGVRKSFLLHRLVLETFTGPPKPGEEARHLDGDCANNRLSNLQWGSHGENELDKLKHKFL